MYTSIFLNPAECLDKSLVEFCRECLIHIESKWSILMLKLKLFQTVGRHDSSSPFGRGRCRSHGRRAPAARCGAWDERLLNRRDYMGSLGTVNVPLSTVVFLFREERPQEETARGSSFQKPRGRAGWSSLLRGKHSQQRQAF